jgi:hypothetical protein
VMRYTSECRVSNFFRAVFTWPVQVPPRFAELLTSSWDQAALAIFAHWLVLTMLLEDLWFVQDFGAVRIDLLAEWLGRWESPYFGLLEWPMEMRKQWRDLKGRHDVIESWEDRWDLE